MIPIQIQLKNFLSYGPEPQTVDFSHYHLICLSGKNGHGKSALLDAITWAIWGQARKTSGNSKADQGLLHLGQKHMFVILEFEVNGQHYRIRREYVHTKSKPFASLDFGIMQDNQKMVALTDKTIKATQDKICKTIGITYEAFSNSTFLRQGQSNEFSKKSPKERKDVLADILQLNQFEDQKKIALIHAKALHLDYKTKLNIQERIENELNELHMGQEQYQELKVALKNLQKEKKELEKKELIINKEQTALAKHLKEAELLHLQKNELSLALNQTKKTIGTISKAWHETHHKIQAVSNKATLTKEYNTLQKQLDELQDKLQKKLVYKEEYLHIKEQFSKSFNQHKTDLEQKRHTIQINLTKKQEQYHQITQQIKQSEKTTNLYDQEIIALQKNIAAIEQQVQQYQHEILEYQEHDKVFEKTKYQYQKLGSQVTFLQQRLEEIQHKIKEIEHGSQVCSLCDQVLTEESNATVLHNLQREHTTIQKTIDTLIAEGTATKKKLHKQYQQLQQYKKQYEASINITTQQQELQKQVEKLLLQKQEQITITHDYIKQHESLHKETVDIQKTIKNLDTQLEQLEKLPELQTYTKQLQDIETKAKQLQYNQEQHQQLQKKLSEYNKLLESDEQRDAEILKQAERKTQLFSLFQTAQTSTAKLQTIAQELAKYDSLDIQKKDLQQKEQALIQEIKIVEKKHTELLIQKGSLEQKQKKQTELHAELKTLVKQNKVLHQELLDYQEIAKALGKDGIQALLIEQAIPEIENEANKVLERLTNNQTHIFIESLRDLKKGGSKETLDIKISDSFGLRDYEMFSGGEAFRIDFALRIGISKLLARKAGTTLQTIFIDEGFGSQDEEGLQLIMDNIHKVQDDFAKVIVVSHLAEMKEQFPVQFIVEKKRSGSTISIIEQG